MGLVYLRTLINGWFLWYVWVNIPCMDPMGITTLYNIYLGNWKKSCMFRLYRGLYYLGKEAIINIIRIYKPTSMIQCQQVFFLADLAHRFVATFLWLSLLCSKSFWWRVLSKAKATVASVAYLHRPIWPTLIWCAKNGKSFWPKDRWLVNVSWAWKTRQDVETFRRKDSDDVKDVFCLVFLVLVKRVFWRVFYTGYFWLRVH